MSSCSHSPASHPFRLDAITARHQHFLVKNKRKTKHRNQHTNKPPHRPCAKCFNPKIKDRRHAVKDRWMCLECGEVLCGRLGNCHTKLHCDENPGHCFFISIDTYRYSIFCQTCDGKQFIQPSLFDNIQDLVSFLDENICKVIYAPKSKGRKPPAPPAPPAHNIFTRTTLGGEGTRGVKIKHATGLENLGSTCYANCILQSLAHTSNIKEFFQEYKLVQRRPSLSREESDLVDQLELLLEKMWSTSSTFINAEAFMNAFRRLASDFPPFQQNDAHQFMRKLLEIVEGCVSNEGKTFTSFFKGTIVHKNSCLNCKTDKEQKPTRFDDINVPESVSSTSALFLQEWINNFKAVRTSDEDKDKSFCNGCGSPQFFGFFDELLELPEILCFYFVKDPFKKTLNSEIPAKVHFPLKGLDMSGALFPNSAQKYTKYDLYSICDYSGDGYYGHYQNYSLIDDKWVKLNDNRVMPISGVERITNPFMLFYKRTHSLSSISRPPAPSLDNPLTVDTAKPDSSSRDGSLTPSLTSTESPVPSSPNTSDTVAKETLNGKAKQAKMKAKCENKPESTSTATSIATAKNPKFEDMFALLKSEDEVLSDYDLDGNTGTKNVYPNSMKANNNSPATKNNNPSTRPKRGLASASDEDGISKRSRVSI